MPGRPDGCRRRRRGSPSRRTTRSARRGCRCGRAHRSRRDAPRPRVGRRRSLGEPHHRRRVGDLDGLAEQLASRGWSRGAASRSPGTTCMIDMSHMPSWLAPSSPVTPRGRVRTSRRTGAERHPSAPVEGPVEDVAYNATMGCSPAIAIPAAEVTACCSAMPTSSVRSGYIDWNLSRPTGCIIAAVMAITSDGVTEVDHLLGEHVGPDPLLGSPRRCRRRAARACRTGRPLAARLLVAEPLAGDRVHDHRSVEALGLGQHELDGRAVVTVDRADVLRPRSSNSPCGARRLEALLHGAQGVVRRGADAGAALRRGFTWSSAARSAGWCAGSSARWSGRRPSGCRSRRRR